MNLVELYSLQSGVRVTNPKIMEKLFPLPFDKFICFGPNSKPSKNYSYYREVLELIIPYLQKENIHIVQIGGPGEQGYEGCFHTQGRTNFNQLSYLISNSLLVFGADSIWQHIAGSYNVPLVDLISNNYSSCVKPYFGDKNKQIILEPARKEGERPSFSLDEGPVKQIDRIKPEEIAISILNLLSISHTITQKTLRFGPVYNSFIFESVPNQVVDLKALNQENFYIRADLDFNLNNILEQISVGPANLITNKPLPINELLKVKHNLKQVIYILWDDYKIDFIEQLREHGINFAMTSYKDEEWITTQKIKLFEYGIIHQMPRRTKDSFEELKDIPADKLFYKSRKFMLSNGKIYPSKAAYIKGFHISVLAPVIQPIIDNADFWYDADHFCLLTQ